MKLDLRRRSPIEDASSLREVDVRHEGGDDLEVTSEGNYHVGLDYRKFAFKCQMAIRVDLKIIWFSIYVISQNICNTAKSLPIVWISISSKDGDGWNHSMRLFVSILLKHDRHWMLLSNYLRNCSRGCSYSTIKVEHKVTHCTSSTKPQTDERKGMVLKNMNSLLFRGKMNLHCENCFIYFNWGNL